MKDKTKRTRGEQAIDADATKARAADEVEPPKPLYSTVTDPVWADAERTMIDCQVRFIHLPEPAPFTASEATVRKAAQV